jgi:hypothetical protein
MNAIALPVERTDSQAPLASLRETRELAMTILREAGTCLMQALKSPPDRRPAIDPTAVFTKVALTVQRLAVAEQRLLEAETRRQAAAARPQPVAKSARPGLADEPRRLARAALHKAAEAEPDRAARTRLRREIDARLAEGEQAGASLQEQVDGICEAFGLEVDWSQQPDELLDALLGPDYQPPEMTPDEAREFIRSFAPQAKAGRVD